MFWDAFLSASNAQLPTGNKALHAIALFEGVKGVAAITASIGLLSLAHHDVRAMAHALIGQFHLDPQANYPRMLLNDATWLANVNLRQTIMLAWAYAAIRLSEGYGLWRDRAWAEWLASLSGAVYLPFEVRHLVQHSTVINGLVLIENVGVVAYVVIRLWQRTKQVTEVAV